VTAIPPGPRYPRPLNTLGWIFRPGPFLERCRERYGPTFTLPVAHEGTWVFMSDPDAIKQIFTGDPEVLHAGEANIILTPLLGERSVLLLDEPEHMTQRKMMLPPFHGERMQRYGELMRDIAEREVRSWPVEQPFRVWPSMQAITLDVILRAVFGLREGERLERIRTALKDILDFVMDPKRMLTVALLGPTRVQKVPLLRNALDPVDELLFEEIRLRREDPELEQREDILSMLVQARHEDGSPMSDQELRDELMTLLVAGHETTATSLAWAVERLLRHPDKLARLKEEAEAGEDEYLDAVVKETLRLRPVIPIVLRLLKKPMEIGGWELPEGVAVAPCIYLVHRDPEIYPEPRRFLPERFLDSPPGTYTWFPFGGGVRRCLGASFAIFEMKVVLSAVARHAALRPASPAPERVRRRAITWTPSRGAEAVVSA
jgi:cytochrome P450 family 135